MTFLLNIDVPDVAKATTFYTEAFGLTVGRRFGADFVELNGWPAPVYLLTKPAGTVGAGGDRRRYERVLSRNRMTPEELEHLQRQNMLLERLQTFIYAGVKV